LIAPRLAASSDLLGSFVTALNDFYCHATAYDEFLEFTIEKMQVTAISFDYTLSLRQYILK